MILDHNVIPVPCVSFIKPFEQLNIEMSFCIKPYMKHEQAKGIFSLKSAILLMPNGVGSGIHGPKTPTNLLALMTFHTCALFSLFIHSTIYQPFYPVFSIPLSLSHLFPLTHSLSLFFSLSASFYLILNHSNENRSLYLSLAEELGEEDEP